MVTMDFVALLRRTNDKPDFIKTFDTFESQIMVFGNLFGIKSVLITFILNHSYSPYINVHRI